MHIDELALASAMQHTGPDASDVGWFAARQPGVVRYLEDHCGPTDAFAVALEAAWRICLAVESSDGTPPPRVPSYLLERAEDSLEIEVLIPGGAADGCAMRQPTLTAWVANLVSNPPIPLDARELQMVGSCLTTVIYALDEVTTGRSVP